MHDGEVSSTSMEVGLSQTAYNSDQESDNISDLEELLKELENRRSRKHFQVPLKLWRLYQERGARISRTSNEFCALPLQYMD